MEESVKGNQSGVPKDEVEHCSHLIEHGKEGNTPPDSWEGEHVPGLMMHAWNTMAHQQNSQAKPECEYVEIETTW